MARVAVVTDSNSGITQEDAKALGCFVVPMPFMFGDDGTTYYEDINLTRDEFFRRLAADESVLTSQPAPTEILKLWDEVLKEYEQIVYIPMSSGLSGSCQSAMMLSSDYEGRVEVVNNQRISVTQKASVIDALELAKRGKSAQEIRDILERVKFDSSIYIMVDTLKYLKKGGRITPAAAAIGTLLRIKPVLQIKGERLDAFSKARTAAQGKNTMLNAMRHDIDTLYGGTQSETCSLYAVHANIPEEGKIWLDEVQAAFPNFKVEEANLSLSICCHIGPGALAVACSKKLDYDNL
ncbi:MAG: DegV family protein [Lachnospiraceae bacterium]|nr:DegV family protein [Lachnospiraceae bacterium]